MKARGLLLGAVCAAAIGVPPAATAALFRAYVASYGKDSNACTVDAPCRLLPAALGVVASGGEIWMLDSANFNSGQVEIAKSVSILAVPGQVGSVSALGGYPAIRIATSGIDVTLRNLVITNNVVSPGGSGIQIVAANSVTVEDSVIAGTLGAGIYAHGPMRIRLERTVIRDSQDVGIYAIDGTNTEVVRCEFIGNRYGGILSQSTGLETLLQVTDSVIDGRDNTSVQGIQIYTSDVGTVARGYVTRTTIFQTGAALDVEGWGTSVLEVSDSMIVRNSPNLRRTGTGVLRSFGNNHISDGVTVDIGMVTPASLR